VLRSGGAVVVAAGLLAAGCGGSKQASTTTVQPRGKTLFVRECGACHRLADAGTDGSVGKGLDQTHPTRAAVVRAIALGTDIMPAHLVTGADAREIAIYVAEATRP
jgi:cytochrome c6